MSWTHAQMLDSDVRGCDNAAPLRAVATPFAAPRTTRTAFPCPMPAPVPLPAGEALATLAHELRDPLAAILSALELHSGDGDPAARRTFTMAAHQARRAVRIVDDLFDLCAGSRDSLPLCKEAVDLAAVVAGGREGTAHPAAAPAGPRAGAAPA